MSTHTGTVRVGFEQRRRVNGRSHAIAAARRETAQDFGGVALGVGIGAVLWMLLGFAARLFG
jgi:hypothetical protein